MRLVYDLIPDLQAVNLAARQVLDPNNRLRDYLPIDNVADIRYRLEQVQRVDPVGAVRAFGTPSRQIRRQGVIEVKGGLPAVSAMDTFSEGDLIRARQMAGLDITGDLEAGVAAAAARTALAVDNRYELLRGAVLSTGSLTISNGEVVQSADFGVDPLNIVTAGTAWTDPTADILGNLDSWMERWTTSGGGQPVGVALTSRRVIRLLGRNDGVRALLAANGQVPSLARPDQVNALFEAYGFPTFEAYDRAIDGTRVIPENRVVFLPGGGTRVGATTIGISEQGVQLAAAGVLQAANVPGVNVATLVEDHPVARHVNADSVGLPVIERPDLLLSASVF